MTDKEKFIKLFDEMGVEYKVYDYSTSTILICDSSLSTSIIEAREGSRLRWGEYVSINFDKQGKFVCFEGWGE